MIPRFRPNAGLSSWLAAFLPAGADEVERFEAGFAELMGQPHAVAFPYGRTGLMLLLEVMGIRDKEVICPAYTCVVVAHAIVMSGNIPVFVDCAPNSFNMDLEKAAKAVTPETAAILPTSLYGHPVDLDALDSFRIRHPQVRVIQDCALSYDANWNGRPVHKEGDAALFSFNAGKLLYAVFAGMVTTSDPVQAALLRRMRDSRLAPAGIMKSICRRAYLAASLPAFVQPVYGFVHRMTHAGLLNRYVKYFDEGVIDMPADHLTALTSVEATAGRLNLPRHAPSVIERRELAALYDRELADLPGVVLPPLDPGATWSHYTIQVPGLLRAGLIDHVARLGVEFGSLFSYSLPELVAYRQSPGVRNATPRAAELASRVVNLPIMCSNAGVRAALEALRSWACSAPRAAT